MISFTSRGASSGEVTGSKHELRIDDEVYLLDCGGWQGSQELEAQNKAFKPKTDYDALILSHSHYDHCSLLPILTKSGYQGNIYCTPATRDLASVVLMDSAKINPELYTEEDVVNCLTHFRGHAYGKIKKLSDKFSFQQFNAGHILGSSMFSITCTPKRNIIDKLLKRNNPINILYTGDLGRENNPIVNPPDTNIPAPDYIILESTYGNRLHESVPYCLEEMTQIINDTYEKGGKIIIPSFAIERAQEIIYYLKVLMAKNMIPKIPVYVDSPMAATATGVFSIHPECFNHIIKDRFISQGKNPFSVSTLHIVKDNAESIKIAKSKKSCIVIAASGMCEKGRIINHLKYGLEKYNNTILTVGYMGENTIGRQLISGANYVVIDNKEKLVKARIFSIGAFSAHADWQEMLDWLNKIDTSKLKKIFLVHGNDEARIALQQHLQENGYKAEIVEKNKEYKL